MSYFRLPHLLVVSFTGDERCSGGDKDREGVEVETGSRIFQVY